MFSNDRRFTLLVFVAGGLLVLLSSCGPSVNQIPAQQTVTINPTFQAQTSPLPTPPTYACGAWTSNNAPGGNATILVYGKLTKDLAGVSGATAVATAHFQTGDVQLDQQVTDGGGFVIFSLSLQGRQPSGVPATIDVVFSNFPGRSITCSTFFTPQ